MRSESDQRPAPGLLGILLQQLQQQLLQHLAAATILHEMIHWADCRDGSYDPSPGLADRGTIFETYAYGRPARRIWADDPTFSDIKPKSSAGSMS
jgi:hypothetical protein